MTPIALCSYMPNDAFNTAPVLLSECWSLFQFSLHPVLDVHTPDYAAMSGSTSVEVWGSAALAVSSNNRRA